METIKEIVEKLNNLKILQKSIEFAKLHVEAALKAASEAGPWISTVKTQILRAYPLTNIK